MRRWTFALAAVAALSACNKEQAAQDVRQTDEELASDNLTTNDLTAIDAASGADSNMAADIDVANMALNLEDEDGPTNQSSGSRRSSPASTGESPSSAPDEDERPATNETASPETDDGAGD